MYKLLVVLACLNGLMWALFTTPSEGSYVGLFISSCLLGLIVGIMEHKNNASCKRL